MLFSGIVKGKEMVVCCIEDGKLLTIYDLLKDESIVNRYPNLQLTSSNLNMPYLICGDAKNISRIFELLDVEEEPSEEDYKAVKEFIDQVVVYSIEDYKNFYKGLMELEKYFTESKVDINFPSKHFENFVQTKNLVDKVKANSKTLRINGNKTIFRDNENSELFIMVPSPDSLAMTETITSFIPSMKNVFVPFKDKELYRYDYKSHLNLAGLTEEQVLGDPNNNNNDIYPEEQRYYDALKELHDVLMMRAHPNNTLEDCVEYSQFSSLFETYISYMLTEVLRYHRNHSGFISLNSYSDEDESELDDGDDKDSNADSLSVNLFYANNKKGNFDGEEVINSLVRDEIKKDVYAPIKLLIQALRFGSKLPSKLKLSDGRFFDLKSFSYSNSSGSFANYEVEKTRLGNNYKVLGTVVANNKILDTSYCQSVGYLKPKLEGVIGLVLQKNFKNSNDSQLVLISLIDLVSFVGLDESLTIDGISVVNNEIKVDTNVIDSSIMDNSMLLSDVLEKLNYPSFVSYVNPYVKGDYLECGCFNKTMSTLSLLQSTLRDNHNLKQLNMFIVVNKDDLQDKVKSYRLPTKFFLDSTLSCYMLDITLKCEKVLYEISLTDFDFGLPKILSVYSEILRELDYPLGVYSGEYGTSKNVASSSSNSTLSNSNVFGSATSQVDNKPVEQQVTQQPVTQQAVNRQSVSQPGTVPNSAPNTVTTANNAVDSSANNSNSIVNGYDTNLLYKNINLDVLVPVVLDNELLNKVELSYKADGKPCPVKVIVSNNTYSVVGFLSHVDGGYVLINPRDCEYKTNKRFMLPKLKPQILTILTNVAFGEAPRLRFENKEAIKYYCDILKLI